MTIYKSIVKVLFTTFICPSICGWQVIKNNNLVPNFPHKTFLKQLRNLTSRSETMLLGTPWSHIISLKNKFVMLVASSILWHVMKCDMLENLSKKKKSLSFFDLDKPKTKFI
jgi:hypothetical protein